MRPFSFSLYSSGVYAPIRKYASLLTDLWADSAPSLLMSNSDVPQIVLADRLSKGLVIKFSNGRCGFFSNELLYSAFPECVELDETDLAW